MAHPEIFDEGWEAAAEFYQPRIASLESQLAEVTRLAQAVVDKHHIHERSTRAPLSVAIDALAAFLRGAK